MIAKVVSYVVTFVVGSWFGMGIIAMFQMSGREEK